MNENDKFEEVIDTDSKDILDNEPKVNLIEDKKDEDLDEANLKHKKTPLEIVNIVLNCIFYVFIFLLLLFSISQIVGSKAGHVKNVFGLGYETVLSDSMMPKDKTLKSKDSFSKGDLIWVNTLSKKEKNKLKVGDIVTFWDTVTERPNQKRGFLNTHRIVDIKYGESNEIVAIVCQGDYYKGTTYDYLAADDSKKAQLATNSYGAIQSCQLISDMSLVKAKYIGKWNNVGTFINWLSNPKRGFIVVILIAVAFLLFEMFMVIKNLMSIKTAKLQKANDEDKQKMLESLAEEKEKMRQEILEQLRKEALANSSNNDLKEVNEEKSLEEKEE